MKIKPIIWTYHPPNPKKDTLFPIKIRIAEGNKKTYFPIGASVTKDQWDAKAGRVKIDKRPNGAEINMKIIEVCTSLESNYIRNESINPQKVSNDFYHYFQKKVDYSKAKHSHFHYKKMKTVMEKMKEYKPNLKVKEVDFAFLQKYELHLISLGNQKNTIYDNFVRIKTVVIDLVKSGLIEYHKNPFLTFKATKTRVERKRLKYSDVKKMGEIKLEGNELLATDMYLASFYCAGIRFGDMCRLDKPNFIQNGSEWRLKYRMNKTANREFSAIRNIKIIPQALEIFKRNNFNFGIKTDFQSISSANAKLNASLKTVCKKVGIEGISFHTSRHSFADLAREMKLDIRTIQELLGHNKVETTEVYMKSFYQEQTDEAMDKLFS
jgi:integrase